MPINPQLWRCWTNVEGSVIFSPRKSHKGQQVAISTHFKKKSSRCLFSARWQLNRSTRCQIAVQTSVEYSKHLTWCCSILNTGTLWSVKCEDTLGENVFQSVSTSFQPIYPGSRGPRNLIDLGSGISIRRFQHVFIPQKTKLNTCWTLRVQPRTKQKDSSSCLAMFLTGWVGAYEDDYDHDHAVSATSVSVIVLVGICRS